MLYLDKKKIYKALLKYIGLNFKLWDIVLLLKREQNYLNNFKLEYNILKITGLFTVLKHIIINV
jgi:hypothetical protein